MRMKRRLEKFNKQKNQKSTGQSEVQQLKRHFLEDELEEED